MTRRMQALGVLLGAEALLAALAHLGAPAAGGCFWFAGAGFLFAIFVHLKPLARDEAGLPPIRLEWLAVHGVSAGLMISAASLSGLIAAGVGCAAAGVLAAVPASAVAQAWRQGASAIAGSAAACGLFLAGARLEEPASHLTFEMVRFALSATVKHLVVQPERLILGTPQFEVMLLPGCSGIWGVGLLVCLFFCWVVVFHDQIRLSRALALLPAAMVLQYLINALRIVAMVLLGSAGAPNVAAVGFHSNAGWIGLLVSGLVLLTAAAHVPGVYKKRPPASNTENAIAPYLTPFLAILAAGLVAGAMSDGFEWAYALRVAAAGAVLWKFRRRYREIDFRSGWIGPLTGAAVFALWIAADGWMGSASRGIPAGLAESSGAARSAWVLFRIAGAVITVPIAEELAFRGLLLQRWLKRAPGPFLQRVPYAALAGSSLVFGVMHGGPWLAATAAGVLYGLASCWRGRLGEAIVAHATTNGLLAGYVLIFGHWNLW